VLTDEGRALLRRAAPVHLRGIQEHFARHLDDDEVPVLTHVLGKVNAAARDDGAHRECPGTILETAGGDSDLPDEAVDARELDVEAKLLAAELPVLDA
jgi:hypothetical protein